MHSWSVVCFDPSLKEHQVKTAIGTLIEILVVMGLNVQYPQKIIPGNPQDFKKTLALVAQNKNTKVDLQLIVCILANKFNGIYAEIKKICLIDLGINSLCFQSRNILRSRWKQICNNLALRINGKLGGTNSRLIPNQLYFKGSKKYMIIGAYFSHPIAAIVASMDSFAVKYADFIKLFEDMNKYLPEAILFYRESVTERQFKIIMEHEVIKLLDAFKVFYQSRKHPPPNLTFVIMRKQHNTRAKPNNKFKADPKGNGNCQPGTVIDKDIVVPQYFNFYLQSHSSLTGTAIPAYYNVFYDEVGFSRDEMQTLTYNLCFLSVRCSLALSTVTHYIMLTNLQNW